MIQYVKVKGIDPSKVSSIHAEVERLNKPEVNGMMQNHPIAKKIGDAFDALCLQQAEAYRDEVRVAQMKIAVERESGSKDPALIKYEKERRREIKNLDFRIEKKVVVYCESEETVKILKSVLKEDGRYEIEIEITSWHFAAEGSVTVTPIDHLGSRIPIPRPKGDFRNYKPVVHDFAPGTWLYGKLLNLLGVESDENEIDLPKLFEA